jgi:hypothetical protein
MWRREKLRIFAGIRGESEFQWSRSNSPHREAVSQNVFLNRSARRSSQVGVSAFGM